MILGSLGRLRALGANCRFAIDGGENAIDKK